MAETDDSAPSENTGALCRMPSPPPYRQAPVLEKFNAFSGGERRALKERMRRSEGEVRMRPSGVTASTLLFVKRGTTEDV